MEAPESFSDPVVVPFPTHLAMEPIRIQFRDDTVNLSQEASNLVFTIARQTEIDVVLVIERILVHFGRVLQVEDPAAFEQTKAEKDAES